MKLSRELNFAHLTSELRRSCPGAGYDDRLLNRVGQARLLGPTLNQETNLDLAAEIGKVMSIPLKPPRKLPTRCSER